MNINVIYKNTEVHFSTLFARFFLATKSMVFLAFFSLNIIMAGFSC